MFWFAQVLSAVAGVFMLLSVLGITKEKYLKMQSIDCIANVLADVLLGGWVGIVLCLGSIVRNNLEVVEEKLQLRISAKLVAGVTCALAAVVAVVTHQFALVVASSAIYTFAIFNTEGIRLEVLLAVDLACWFFYDIGIRSYPMAIVDAIVFVRALLKVRQEASDGQIIQVAVRGEKAEQEEEEEQEESCKIE